MSARKHGSQNIVKAPLRSRGPLNDIYKEYKTRETQHMDMLRDRFEAEANVRDVCETSKLPRDEDDVVYGDSAYSGAPRREEIRMCETLRFAHASAARA